LGLSFGRIHCVTDRPSATSAISRAEELRQSLRAYSYLVTPLHLVDWSLDEYGRFRWVVISEPGRDMRYPGGEREDVGINYRCWYPDHYELYTAVKENTYALLGEGPHPCGEVPVSTLWATRDARTVSMDCESPLGDILDIDRDILNKLSELDELERTQSFSILWLPEADGGPSGPIDISPYRAIAGSSDAGSPQYISPDSTLAAGKWQRIQEKLFMARQLAGVGRGQAEFSREERSADAISVESEDKRNQMSWWAAATEEFERALHRHVSAWENVDIPPTITYPRNFDLKGIRTQIDEIVQLNATSLVSRDTLLAMAKPLVTKILREHGLESNEIKKAISNIEVEPPMDPPVDIHAAKQDLRSTAPDHMDGIQP
jgi:hypothetical protein